MEISCRLFIRGKKEVAQKLIAKASVTNASYAYDFTYGSEERDLAVILRMQHATKRFDGR